MKLITRNQLAILNRQHLKYPLSIAEKDYFLALVLKIIFDSNLKDNLVFKGGTALHHVYLPQLRFSEDLDFSSNHQMIDLSELRAIFQNYDFLKIKKDYQSLATVKIEKLQYTGPLSQAGSLKIDIDSYQKIVLKPIEAVYNNFYGLIVKVKVMDIREIAAEKIRAMSDRARYRDYYDYAMIMKNLSLNLAEVLRLVRQKEIRKTISLQKIINHWQMVCSNQKDDRSNIYYGEILSDQIIKDELNRLKFKDITI